MYSLSVIFPCYNESGNIEGIISSLSTALEGRNDVEIILVDNGSTDSTPIILEQTLHNNHNKHIKTIKINKNIGYGHGIMAGVRAASGDVIAWTHADLQTDPADVVDAYQYFVSKNVDRNFILKGKRKKRKLFDSLFTSLMSIVSSIAFNIRLSDINAQPKMFSKNFIQYIDNAPNDFSLDLFILVKAIKMDYTILEYPVMFKNRYYGISKGGGSFIGKIKLTLRTLSYINKLRITLKK